MIKMGLDEECIKEIEDKHLQYATEYIKEELKEIINKIDINKNKEKSNLFKRLDDEFKNIIIGKPNVLIRLVEYTEDNSNQSLYVLYNNALEEIYKENITKEKVIKKIREENDKKEDEKKKITKEELEKLEKYYESLKDSNQILIKVIEGLKKDEKNNFNDEIKGIFDYVKFGQTKQVHGHLSLYKLIKDLSPRIKNTNTIKEKKENIIKEIDKLSLEVNTIEKSKLLKLKVDIEQINHNGEECNFKNKILELYEQKKFKDYEWGAYPLVKKLDIKVCPYCNRQYISIDDDEVKGKTRPELDHFLCQSEFPFYSISLYNLVPSCHVCNSNLKSNERFVKTSSEDEYGKDYMEALNPYEDGFGENYTFSINCDFDKKNNYDFLFQDSSEFNIGFRKHIIEKKNLNTITEQIKLIKMAQVNKEIFHLESLYNNNHKDTVCELIKIAKIYNEEYLDELFNNYRHIFNSKKEIMGIVLSNYLDKNDFHKRVMSKFVYDIGNELGILAYIDDEQ